MNAKDAILKIRALFEDLPTEIPNEVEAKVEFKEYSLKDGSKVNISDLVVDGDVVALDGSPVADGEYILADDTSIQVVGSKIIQIASPKEDVLPELDTPGTNMGKQKMDEDFSALKLENENLSKKIIELEAKVKAGFSQVAELIEALTKVPSSEPIAQPKQNFSKNQNSQDMKLDRIEKYRNALLNK
ncbi:MAG: hypothetical protein D4R41_01655 [Sediminibacterium sp.]|nr:MAG: hypothetical protein D4R41_01655 [Sediminibacterium sp.]